MLTPIALSLLLSGAAPGALLSFYGTSNGGIASIGQVQQCLSDPPIYATRVQAYAGFSVRGTQHFLPAVNEIWYAHVLMSHPSNPCSGGSYVGVEVALPANTSFAISADNPVFCVFRNASGAATVYYRFDQGCPQSPFTGSETGFYNFPLWNGSSYQPWPMASYTYAELLIPMKSSSALLGQPLRFRVNPDVGVVGYPQVGMQVTSEVIFRTDMENDSIFPDACAISGTTSCSVAP